MQGIQLEVVNQSGDQARLTVIAGQVSGSAQRRVGYAYQTPCQRSRAIAQNDGGVALCQPLPV